MSTTPPHRGSDSEHDDAGGTRPPTSISTSNLESPQPFSWRFKGGNLSALRSGHRSPRIVSALAEDLVAFILDERPDLSAAEMAPVVSSWARAESVAALLAAALDSGVEDAEGEPRSRLMADWRGAERLASEARLRLGLDPLASAKLARSRIGVIGSAEQLRTKNAMVEDAKRRLLLLHPELADENGNYDSTKRIR